MGNPAFSMNAESAEELPMARGQSLVYFRSGRFDLDDAAHALADRGLTVDRHPARLSVCWVIGPRLSVLLERDKGVRQEAMEIGEGTLHADALSRCNVRFVIGIDDLDAVLDEINTLIEVQATLQNATQGFLFNTWNGELLPPGE